MIKPGAINSESMQMSQHVRWHVYPSVSDLVDRAAAAIQRIAAESIRLRGEFLVVLAGGTTPKLIYQQLAEHSADWSRWKIFYGDERCLPADHPERNSVMAASVWLAAIEHRGAKVFPIPAEQGPDQGAAVYRETLRGLGTFDLVLLGLGEDGHTASLFPGHEWGRNDADPTVLPVRSAPKPPPERISLSAARLSHTRQLLVFVTGTGKLDAVSRWRSGQPMPILAVQPPGGVDALVSVDAWKSDRAAQGR